MTITQSGTCDGDTGSPVIRRISGSETAREAYYEQQYLVTTGIDCRLKTKIYVRLSHRQILSWIQQETENVPLVMVVGGYISGVANGDVELIDPNDYRDTKICKRKIAPVPINIAGHVGKYTNGAPRVCGGKNDAGRVVKNCYEYNIVNNEWEEMKSLKKKRRDSIGLLNDDDELWVCNSMYRAVWLALSNIFCKISYTDANLNLFRFWVVQMSQRLEQVKKLIRKMKDLNTKAPIEEKESGKQAANFHRITSEFVDIVFTHHEAIEYYFYI